MNDKNQLAAMGEHLADQQPLCMAKRIEELEAGKVGYMLVGPEPGEPDGGTILRDPVGRRKSIPRSDAERAMFGVHIPDPVGSLDEIPAPAVPEGWQLVPVEPTESMIGHGCGASVMVVSEVVTAWGAMLAASPKPEAK